MVEPYVAPQPSANVPTLTRRPTVSSSTTQLPAKQPQHRHRIFPPPDPTIKYDSIEAKFQARRKEMRERQRHLEALLAEAATKGSSDTNLMNEHLINFADDNNSKSSIDNNNNFKKEQEKPNNQTVTKVSSTFSTSPGPLPLPAPTQSTVRVTNSDENSNSGKDDSGEFGEIVSAVWGKVKGMIGFTPDCLNGGTKRLGGKCFCPEYFLGEHCEKKQCLNNGTLQRISTIPPEEICKCINPLYITGKHCETIHCQNGGRPLTNGTCKCIDNWYTGDFCQHYAASWFAVLGIPLICIAVIALCCVICRLDFCPKRTPTTVHRENRRRNRGPQELRRHHHHHRHAAYGHDDPQTLMIHENLLNECHHQFRRPPTASHSSGQIVRLENIPVYNPTIPHLPTDEYKPLEPPPSYEQAVSNCPAISTPILSTRAQPPPIYSPPRPDDNDPLQPITTFGNSRPPEEDARPR